MFFEVREKIFDHVRVPSQIVLSGRVKKRINNL